MHSLYHQPGVGTVSVSRCENWDWCVYRPTPDGAHLACERPSARHVPVHTDRAVWIDRRLYLRCGTTQQWQQGDTGALREARVLPFGTADVDEAWAVACPGVRLRRSANEALEALEAPTGHGVVAVPPSRAQWLCATSTETEDCAVWQETETGRLALRIHRRGAEEWEDLYWVTPPAQWCPAHPADGEADVLFATAVPGRYLLAVLERDRGEVRRLLPLSVEVHTSVGTAGRPPMPVATPATDRRVGETPTRRELVSYGSPWLGKAISAGPVHPHATRIVQLAESWWNTLSAPEREETEPWKAERGFGLPLATAALLLGTAGTTTRDSLRRLANRIGVVARYVDRRLALFRRESSGPRAGGALIHNTDVVDDDDEAWGDSDPVRLNEKGVDPRVDRTGLDAPTRYDLRTLLSAYALLQDEPAECTTQARQHFYAEICKGQYLYQATAGDELALPLIRVSQSRAWHHNCALLYDAHGGAIVWRKNFTLLEHEMVVYDREGHGLLVPPPDPYRLGRPVAPSHIALMEPLVAPTYALDHVVTATQLERYTRASLVRPGGPRERIERALPRIMPEAWRTWLRGRDRPVPPNHAATAALATALQPVARVPLFWCAPDALPWRGVRGYLGETDYALLSIPASSGLDPAAVFHLATAVACFATGVWRSREALSLFLFAVDPRVAQGSADTPVLWEARALEQCFLPPTVVSEAHPDLGVADIQGLRCHGLFLLFLARATAHRGRSDTKPDSGPRSWVVRAVAVLRDLCHWLWELHAAAGQLDAVASAFAQRDNLARRVARTLAAGQPKLRLRLLLALHALGLQSMMGRKHYALPTPPRVDERLRWLLRWLQTAACDAVAVPGLPPLHAALRREVVDCRQSWSETSAWLLPMPWDREHDAELADQAPVSLRLGPYNGAVVPEAAYTVDGEAWLRIRGAALRSQRSDGAGDQPTARSE